MKKLLFVFLSIAFFSAGSAYAAHAKLVRTLPEDGSVSNTPPTAFVLEFSEAVTLHRAYIKKDNDKEKPLQNPQHSDLKTLTIAAPALTAGHYVLEWSVFTHDSIVLNGRIRFTVSGESIATPSSTQ
jgi:methionine-rich copper-binding protein CopC